VKPRVDDKALQNLTLSDLYQSDGIAGRPEEENNTGFEEKAADISKADVVEFDIS
jgi:hypothetical protein